MESDFQKPKLYGVSFSVYVQAVRLTLHAKGVIYDLQQENPFDPATLSKEFNTIQPFGKVPAFRHGSVQLYQADVIARYIDDAFPGPALMPTETKARATANQIIGILNSYAYPNWVRRLYVQLSDVKDGGGTPDANLIEKARPVANLALREIQRLGFPHVDGFLTGATPALPDFFCAPMLECLLETDIGHRLIKGYPEYAPWMKRMKSLPEYDVIVI